MNTTEKNPFHKTLRPEHVPADFDCKDLRLADDASAAAPLYTQPNSRWGYNVAYAWVKNVRHGNDWHENSPPDPVMDLAVCVVLARIEHLAFSGGSWPLVVDVDWKAIANLAGVGKLDRDPERLVQDLAESVRPTFMVIVESESRISMLPGPGPCIMGLYEKYSD